MRREEREFPPLIAFLYLIFMTYINIATLLIWLKITLNFTFEYIELSGFELGAVYLLFFVPHYFLLMYKKRYLIIAKEFSNEDIIASKRRIQNTYYYVFGSSFFFICGLFLLILTK